jgi:hypothetical protein
MFAFYYYITHIPIFMSAIIIFHISYQHVMYMKPKQALFMIVFFVMAPCPLISTTLRVFQRCPTSLTVVINFCKFSTSYESHFIQDIMVRLRRLLTSKPVMTVMHVLRHSTHWSTVIRKQNLLDRNDSTNMKNINQHEDDDYANSKSRASDRAIKQGTFE